ncbi:MAG: anhydro-N-acetylmuramic acid kinase [Rhodospirillales bacterium]|nr:anhydro-N-acetylmuramic acid kinase [Rhodospirillales bacterium]
MSEKKVYTAMGLMSGTSLDGEIDVALIETDGHDFVKPLAFYAHPYDINIRDQVRACFGKTEKDNETEIAEKLVTDIHIAAVKASGFKADIIGFHGQTISHYPENNFTWQLGDGARMAAETGMDVINDFRTADVKAGGQGAPLAPLYHRAIMEAQDKPVAVLNLGGVANVTYVSKDGKLIAFDTGPANALMDDYVSRHLGREFDVNGELAASGKVDAEAIISFLQHPYFLASPPKSLDRNTFETSLPPLPEKPEDALATLSAFTVEAIAKACDHFPSSPMAWFTCGGGRKNAHLIESLQKCLDVPVKPIEGAGYNGDAIEAECFAYLAVRSLLGLPLSLPETTGVPQPQTGGELHSCKTPLRGGR